MGKYCREVSISYAGLLLCEWHVYARVQVCILECTLSAHSVQAEHVT